DPRNGVWLAGPDRRHRELGVTAQAEQQGRDAVADGRAGYTGSNRGDGACCLEAEHGVRGQRDVLEIAGPQARSVGLMPAALTLILICPSPGSRSGTPAHFSTSGGPYPVITIALGIAVTSWLVAASVWPR